MDAKPRGGYDHRRIMMKVTNEKEGWEWTVYPDIEAIYYRVIHPPKGGE